MVLFVRLIIETGDRHLDLQEALQTPLCFHLSYICYPVVASSITRLYVGRDLHGVHLSYNHSSALQKGRVICTQLQYSFVTEYLSQIMGGTQPIFIKYSRIEIISTH